MSALLFTGLGAIGAYLNKNKKQPREDTNLRTELSTADMPNGRNIYHSNRTNQVRRDVQHQANALYEQARDTLRTGVMPPFWADENIPKAPHKNIQQRAEKDPYNIINPNEYKTLSEENVNNPYFNNAYYVKKPFATDQSMPERCENIQENFTHQNMVPFFRGSGTVKTIDHDDRDLETFTGQTIDRFEKTELEGLFFEPSRQNPWSTPALNVGLENRYITSIYRTNELPTDQQYVSKPTIYTDGIYRLHEKNVDELRAKSNPKNTYSWDATPGKNYVTNSGKVARFKKYKPDRFRTQDMGDLIVTTGDVIRPKIPDQYEPEHTFRTNQDISYKGSLGPASQQWRSNKQNTQYEGAPTIKELDMYSTGDQNPYGVNKQNGMTVYDPNDINGPTLKEADMFRTGDQNPYGVNKQNGMTVYDPDDLQQRTLKETHMFKTGDQNIHGAREQSAMTVYDPEDVQTATLKQKHMYKTGDHNVNGANEQSALTVYDPADVQITTLKQKHMYKTGDQGVVSTNDQKGVAYAVANYTAYPTLKQNTTNHQYSGSALTNNPIRRNYQAEESLHIKGLKGITNVYRTPTQNGDKKPLGIEDYNIKTPKEGVRWNKRIEKDRIYNPITRVIPFQELKRDDVATASRFMPEIMNVPNMYVQNINVM